MKLKDFCKTHYSSFLRLHNISYTSLCFCSITPDLLCIFIQNIKLITYSKYTVYICTVLCFVVLLKNCFTHLNNIMLVTYIVLESGCFICSRCFKNFVNKIYKSPLKMREQQTAVLVGCYAGSMRYVDQRKRNSSTNM